MNDSLRFTNFPDDFLQATLTEHFYGDGGPKWKSQPTSAEAISERNSRVRLFRKHSANYLVEKLTACQPEQRCFSGACPECTRAVQRFFVRRVYRSLTPSSDFSLVSLIPNMTAQVGALDRLSIAEFRRDIASKLAESRLSFAFGGIDFSLNEHQDGKFDPYWAPHVWLVVSNVMYERWSVLLSAVFPKSRTILRPMRIQAWNGKRRALGYALKYNFDRRISYTTARSYLNGVRECRNTRKDKLRSSERFELYSYLDQISIGSRIFLSQDDDPEIASIRLQVNRIKIPTKIETRLTKLKT